MKKYTFLILLFFSALSQAQFDPSIQNGHDSLFRAKKLAKEAEVLVDQFNLEEAEKKYAEAIQYYPQFFNYYVAYINVCKSMQCYEKAIPVLTKGVEVLPNYDELWFYLGQSYKKTGNPNTAIEYYSKAIEIIEDRNEPILVHYAYYMNRSNCYLINRDFEKVAADLTKAIEINPNSSQLYMNRAKAYLNLKKKAEACADWQKAYEMGNNAALPYIDKVCGE